MAKKTKNKKQKTKNKKTLNNIGIAIARATVPPLLLSYLVHPSRRYLHILTHTYIYKYIYILPKKKKKKKNLP